MRLWPRRRVYLDNLPRTHDVRFMVVFVVGLAMVFGALYAVGYAVAGNKLPRGTTVADVDVGGMSPGQARTVLQEKLAPRLQTPITARVNGRKYTLDPQLSGLTFDIEETVDQATGGSPWDPRHMMHVVLGGDELEPKVSVDEPELAATLDRIAKDVDRKPVDSRVVFKQKIAKVHVGQAGRALDFQRSGDRLISALVSGDKKVDLATKAVQPEVDAITAARFVDSVAERAMSAPVRITVADASLRLPPSVFGPALQAVPSERGLELEVDTGRLMQKSARALATLPHHPVNARIAFAGDRPRVEPGRAGLTVDPDNLAQAVLEAVQHKGDARTARTNAIPDNPQVTTDDIKQMRIRERVSSASARYSITGAQPDPANQVSRLDGALIGPGEDFSYLRRLPDSGSPAASFVASLAYDAAFKAGLDIPEHTSAHFYTGEFAPGHDAHVEPPSTNLVVRNSTPYGVYVRAYVEKPGGDRSRARVAHVELWSTQFWSVTWKTSDRYKVVKPDVVKNPKRSCLARDGHPGFEIDLTRKLTRDGHMRSDVSHASYAVVDEVRCTYNRPKPNNRRR